MYLVDDHGTRREERVIKRSQMIKEDEIRSLFNTPDQVERSRPYEERFQSSIELEKFDHLL